MSATCAAGHRLAQAGRACRACRVALVVDRVVAADPSMPVDVAQAAVDTVAVHGATLRDLARVLADGHGPLLVGAPGTVGRLVVELRARGSALPEPVCVRCGRAGRELIVSGDGGVCSRCRNHQLASPCAVCGITKPVAARDAERRPLCAVCAPRPQRPCARCGRVRVIARRARHGDGDLCDRCYKGPPAECTVCGQTKACNFVAEGRPICASCSPRRHLVCAHCGQRRPPTVRWPEGPVCEPCYRAALNRRGVCAGCSTERRLVHPPGPAAARCADCAGVVDRLACCAACGAEQRLFRRGLCGRCALSERAREVLGDVDGPLATVRDAIVAAAQPYSAHNWLRSGVSAAILADIASGALPLTHEALDAHPRRRAANYLRHILVAHGALPARNDAIVRLEAWVADRLATVSSPHQRRLLRSYATWRVVRRARQRAETARRPAPTARAKTCLNAAIAFLAFLDTNGTDLAGCTQADIDTWITTGPPSAPEIADFVDWAKARQLLADVAVPARPRNHGPALDNDTRWQLARRLLHDDTLQLGDRVAGCLVVLYGQQLSRIITIRRDQISHHHDTVRLHLGATHIDVPEPLATLLNRLAHTRRPNTSIAAVPSPWLFPGIDPGQPLNAAYLSERLRRLGIPTMPSRRSALTHLASRLPAAILADLLGIAPTTAVHWVRTAGGDWNTYAAQLVHDHDREP